jgi:hypothetical protein
MELVVIFHFITQFREQLLSNSIPKPGKAQNPCQIEDSISMVQDGIARYVL